MTLEQAKRTCLSIVAFDFNLDILKAKKKVEKFLKKIGKTTMPPINVREETNKLVCSVDPTLVQFFKLSLEEGDLLSGKGIRYGLVCTLDRA